MPLTRPRTDDWDAVQKHRQKRPREFVALRGTRDLPPPKERGHAVASVNAG